MMMGVVVIVGVVGNTYVPSSAGPSTSVGFSYIERFILD